MKSDRKNEIAEETSHSLKFISDISDIFSFFSFFFFFSFGFLGICVSLFLQKTERKKIGKISKNETHKPAADEIKPQKASGWWVVGGGWRDTDGRMS